jgi:hypothetical protein
MNPALGFVSQVPDQRETPAGPEYSGDLRDGRLPVNPVKGLRHDDHVERRVLGRNRLGGTLPGVRGRQYLPQLYEHRPGRFYGDDIVAGGNQVAGQLACSGAQVKDAARPISDEPADGLGRVARS